MNEETEYMLDQVKIHHDCRYFRGSKPCSPNKSEGAECKACRHYAPIQDRILIIKLDAIGDVIRTLSIIPSLLQKHKDAYIVWITRTESVEMVRSCPNIDEVWEYGTSTLVLLQSIQWDWVYNLSNDHVSAGLASIARVTYEGIGYIIGPQGIEPTNGPARRWLEMACFDSIKQDNSASYQEHMYEIAGIDGPISPPQIRLSEELIRKVKDRLTVAAISNGDHTLIGINTGAGSRWPKKAPDVLRWGEIIIFLLNRLPHAKILLLGGPLEANKNKEIENRCSCPAVIDTGANWSLLEFTAIIKCLDVLVCGDTLALHLATATRTPTVALFGPTSYSEIHSFGSLIVKLRPENMSCLCCYGDCDREDHCMVCIPEEAILEAILRQLGA